MQIADESVPNLVAVLDEEFAKLRETEGSFGSAIANVVREVDYVYLYLRSSGQFTPEYTNHFETLHQYGWPLLLRAWYSQIDPAQPQSVADSTYDLTGRVDSMIHRAGQIARCRQLLLFCEMGFGALTPTAELEFTFTLTVPNPNTEAYDLLDFKWVQKEIIDKRIRKQKARDGFDFKLVDNRIKASVKRPTGLCLDYHPTRYVADYFAREGHYHLERLQLHDDFGPTDLFDSIPYGDYVKMVEYLAGMALMHEAYSRAALKKSGSFEMRNVLSAFCNRKAIAIDLARHLGRTTEETARMLARVTLSHDNYQEYLEITSAPPAPFFQISNAQYMRSIAGCLNNPFFFLNYELKRTYRPDYDVVVNNREDRFREMVYTLFPGDRFIRIPNEVKFSTVVGRKPETDIDAIVFDTQTKTLGLFQLKWQDPFAHSMKKRRNAKTSLQKNALSWLEKVLAWLARNDDKSLLNALQVTRHSRAENTVAAVRIFVLARRNIHFTGVSHDERAAWGSWPQVIAGEARAGSYTGSGDRIKALYDRLRFDAPDLRMKREGQLLPAKFDLVVGHYRVCYQ